MLAQDKAIAKKIFAFHGIHTPSSPSRFRGRLDFSHDLQFPVIVKPAREDGSIGIEFSAVVNSIRELMERMDWLHANFDSPVLIEEYIEGREMYVGVIGNDKPEALPVVELDLSKLPDGTPRIAAAEVKWGKGTKAYRDTKSAIATDLPEETVAGAAADGRGRLPGAGAARLRPRRHAAAARRPGAGHRGQPESVAQLAGGVRDGGAQVGPHLSAADRRDRRARAWRSADARPDGSLYEAGRPMAVPSVSCPQIQRPARRPSASREGVHDVGLPVAHREAVRDDAGAGAKLAR